MTLAMPKIDKCGLQFKINGQIFCFDDAVDELIYSYYILPEDATEMLLDL